jgi:hypothetical protein
VIEISKADKLIVEAMGFRFESSGPDTVHYLRFSPRDSISEGRDSFFMTVLRWAKGRQWWTDFIAKTGWHDSKDVSCAAIPVEYIDGQILSRRLYEYLVAEMSEEP